MQFLLLLALVLVAGVQAFAWRESEEDANLPQWMKTALAEPKERFRILLAGRDLNNPQTKYRGWLAGQIKEN